MHPAQLLQDGQSVGSTYVVERLIGSGAFGEVYRVRHKFLGRQAMKVFKRMGMSIGEIETLLDEPIMLSQIGHPNIIRVFDANTINTSTGIIGFFTMEYVAGGTLEHFWQSFGPRFLGVAKSVDLVSQICRGLSVAHSQDPPMIHRDIKPQNVLVGYDADGERVRISDFGLAKHVNPLTLLASAQGDLRFKPPEIFEPGGYDSTAADVWAVGAVLYLLLTDVRPYQDSLHASRFDRPLISASHYNGQVDGALDEIVHRALACSPADRYATSMALLNDLESWRSRPVSKAKESEGGWISVGAKESLGSDASPDECEARRLIRQALDLARHWNRLSEAADLMEEALNKAPQLREAYDYHLRLWRKGIIS